MSTPEVTAGFQRGSEQPVCQTSKCEDEVTQYLVLGGLFNPEQMEHDKVRDLATAQDERDVALVDLREYKDATLRLSQDLDSAREDLAQAECQRDAALRQLAQAVEILTDIQARVREVGV